MWGKIRLLLFSLFHSSFSCTWACMWIHLHALTKCPKVFSKYWMKNLTWEILVTSQRDCVDVVTRIRISPTKTAPARSCTHARTQACCCCLFPLERLYLYMWACPSLSEFTKWNYICCLAVSLSWLFCGGGRKSISLIVCTKITAKGWKRGCDPLHAVPAFHQSLVFLSIFLLDSDSSAPGSGEEEPRFNEQLTCRSTCTGNVWFFIFIYLFFFVPLFVCFWIFFIQR